MPTATGRPGRAVLRADDTRLAPWRSFLVAHSLVTRRLDEELRASHGMSLAEYDALLQIARTPSRRLRMNRLAEQVLLSRSGVTRLIDRLVAQGFVDRSICLSDARGAEAVLTDAGLRALRHASITHLAGIERYFLDALDAGDLETIGRSLSVVTEKLGQPGSELEPGPAE